MSLEDDLFQQRLRRRAEIEQLGFRPYGQRFDFSHTIPQILTAYSDKTAEQLADKPQVRIAGRILTIRRMGKAGFMHLQQSGEQIQVYVRKDAVSENEYKLYEILDLGDIVGIDGYIFRTRTGELSIHAEKITFLSKILLNMPEKWHGLEDVEIRYRQRYLDLIANPESQKIFITRAKIISSLRRRLEAHGFVEVETPMMQPIYGGATARPFVTHHNTLDMDLYLRIAPELYLKRLIVGGMDRVYEINRNFRSEGISTQHNPEFTMLEFYQAYTDYHGMMDLSEHMMRHVAQAVVGSLEFEYGKHHISFEKFQRFTMKEAIARFWPQEAAPGPKVEDFAEPKAVFEWIEAYNRSAEKPLAFGDDTAPGAALAELFEVVVEKHLIQPTFILDFPLEVSPLAKQKPDDPNFVERFELYIGGMEIANAFSELNDPREQKDRFEYQQLLREKGDLTAHTIDEDYIRALSYGMPPAGGEGIG